MAKINPINGKITGKIGGSVYSVVKGQNIWKEKPATVRNPKTPIQVAARAKFKLLNQIAANVESYIAIKAKGAKTPRNQFVARNYELAGFGGDQAFIALPDLQLTNSTIGMSGFSVTRADSKLNFTLDADMSQSIDAVAYVVFHLEDVMEMLPAASIVTSTAGDNGLFEAELDDVAGDLCIYCYGIRYNSNGAYNRFGSLNVTTADGLAKLVVTSNFENAIGAFTETRGMVLNAAENSGQTTGVNSVVLSLTSYDRQNSQTLSFDVTGAGSYTPGTSVTVSAPTVTNYTFVGWYNAARNTLLSANASYTFTLATSTTICAVYDGPVQGADDPNQGND